VATLTVFRSNPNFDGPEHLAFDSAGTLYVSDFLGGQVEIFRPPFSFLSSNVPVAIVPMPVCCYAGGIAIDHAGRLFVGSDGLTAPVHVFTPPFSSGMSESFEIAGPSSSGPDSLLFDSSGNLYVAYQGHAGPSSVAIFAPPFSANSAPLFQITHGIAIPAAMVFAP
jgi:sugar lactone lactonase YvrE